MIRFSLDTFMNTHNLSIQDVIDATGISRPTISQYYNGKAKGIQFETLDKIMTGLNAELYELFDTVFSIDELHYDIELIDPNGDRHIIDEEEPTLIANFFYDENVKEYGTIVSFRMPLFVDEIKHGNSTDLTINCLYDAIDILGDEDSFHERQLTSFLTTSDGSYIEGTMGSIALAIIELIKPKSEYKNIFFKCDITNGTNNHSFDGYAFAYAWTYDTIKDRNFFAKWIDSKYGAI